MKFKLDPLKCKVSQLKWEKEKKEQVTIEETDEQLEKILELIK